MIVGFWDFFLPRIHEFVQFMGKNCTKKIIKIHEFKKNEISNL